MYFDDLNINFITPITTDVTKCIKCENECECILNIKINIKNNIEINIKSTTKKETEKEIEKETEKEYKCPLTSINNDIRYDQINIYEEKEEKKVMIKSTEQIRIQIYTKEERQELIKRYKKKKRNFKKKILYKCRKRFADLRPRVGGRFVSLTKEEKKKLCTTSKVFFR